jgi:hypothetical protein
MTLLLALAGALLVLGVFRITVIAVRLAFLLLKWACLQYHIFTIELQDDYVGGIAGLCGILISLYVLTTLS